MALTYSNLQLYSIGNRRMHRFDIDFDTVYPPGGETLQLREVRLRVADMVLISPKSGYTFEYDYDNDKILVMNPTAEIDDTLLAEVEAGAIPVKSSAEAGSIIALSGAAGVTGTVATEVPGATDLGLLVDVRALVIGY